MSTSVTSSRDGFDVVQLCAMIMGLPVSSVMFLCEAGLSSLCTLSSNFMCGWCSWFCGVGSSKVWLLWLEIMVEKRCLSLLSNLLEFVTVLGNAKIINAFVSCDVRKMSVVFCRKP